MSFVCLFISANGLASELPESEYCPEKSSHSVDESIVCKSSNIGGRSQPGLSTWSRSGSAPVEDVGDIPEEGSGKA